MVKLRLKRIGRKGRPFYRIVAIHSTLARGGPALSELGTYDPVHARVEVDEKAAIDWLKRGAQMSETVHDLLKSQGILARFRGFEGTVREGALSKDKPKRRKKLNKVPDRSGETEPASEADTSPSDSEVPEAESNDKAVASATSTTVEKASERPEETGTEKQ